MRKTHRRQNRDTDMCECIQSNLVDVDFLFVSEFECALSLLLAERLGLVDLGIFWQFAICFHYKNGLLEMLSVWSV